jgi:hypothetical protein
MLMNLTIAYGSVQYCFRLFSIQANFLILAILCVLFTKRATSGFLRLVPGSPTPGLPKSLQEEPCWFLNPVVSLA